MLPLRGTVVFPGVAVPISAGRPGTVEAVQESLEGDRRLFAVAQRKNVDRPKPTVLYRVGTIVRVIQTHRARRGIQLLVQGEGRAQAKYYEEDGEAMLRAPLSTVEKIGPADSQAPAFVALDAELRQRAAELGTRRGVPSEALSQLIQGMEDPGAFADLVAFYLEQAAEEKQALLETLDDEERMRACLMAVEKELVRIDAQEDIQAKVQEHLGERQREMLLREQMKQIRKELGEEGERNEVEELRERLEALDLGDTARKEVERELRRLGRTQTQSAEYQVIRTYLEWVAELPWNVRTDDKIDLRLAEDILAEDHYGLEDVKDRVLEFLAVRKLQQDRRQDDDEAEDPAAGEDGIAEAGTAEKDAALEVGDASPAAPGQTGEAADSGEPADRSGAASAAETAGVTSAGDDSEPGGEDAVPPEPSRPGTPDPDDASRPPASGYDAPGSTAPILLFAGPPGVGKTSIARSIARSVGRKYVRISLGGARDEADIRGHRRTYVGSMPGRIIQGIKEAGAKNPVFLLDEVDKLGVSFQGDPSSALLEVLDPAQNQTFIDHYLGVPFDLSEVLFIATANSADRIPAPMLDRMELVEFRGYTEKEKLEIARRYLAPRQVRDSGLREDEIEIEDEAILAVVRKYTREAGVRQLERETGKLARKVARQVASGASPEMTITPEKVRDLLGQPRVHQERRAAEDAVGVATGMFYTPMGGDIMFVEASVMPGEGDLVLTGQLGDVMKESARAALSYAKSNVGALEIAAGALDKREIHIHVPAGAVPKDGPSAGITMATALISAVSGRKVRSDVAMTGELTLTGRVLPVGGVREKVLGAVRAGIREIVLPHENKMHLEDLPDAVREELTVHLVEDLHRVVEVAVRTPGKKQGTWAGVPAEDGSDPPQAHA